MWEILPCKFEKAYDNLPLEYKGSKKYNLLVVVFLKVTLISIFVVTDLNREAFVIILVFTFKEKSLNLQIIFLLEIWCT